MKRTLFSLSVAACLLALSCTKEPVNENVLPAAEGEASGLCFTASFETVKSTLDDNQQPKWVAGDVIGVTSAQDNNVQCALVDAAAGTFSGANINGNAPYAAVYPWNASFSFAGDVVSASVPAVQQLAGGQKIAPGAMVAACVSNTTTLAFRNCTCLMRLDITRSDIKSIKVETTKEGEYLAGDFTMDMGADTPVATPVAASASASVTLLPEGTAFAAGNYYIAILPAEYTSLKITFTNTANQTAVATKSTKTTCGRSQGLSWGSFFSYSIGNAEALIAWSQSAPKFTAWDTVNLTADIALTTEQAARYVEAADFMGTFNGGNHSITGLTTPLFGNLYGAVSNLDLTATIQYDGTDARITGTDYGIGILAHYVYEKMKDPVTQQDVATGAAVNNVTTRGSLLVSGLEKTHNYMVGGIVGSSNGVLFSGCKNYASVTLDGVTLSGKQSRVGGITGVLQYSANAGLTSCENYGEVNIVSMPAVGDVSVGGVAGYVTVAANVTGCTNNGAVHCSATSSSTVAVAGVVASFTKYVTMSGCENKAAVSLAGSGKYGYAGGFVAHFTNGAKLQNPINRGNVNCTGTFSDMVRAGGLVGNYVCAASEGISSPYGQIENGKNYGEVKNQSATSSQVRLGGFFGAATSGAVFVLSGENRGDVTNVSSGSLSELCQGGVAGYIGTSGSKIDGTTSKCIITTNVVATSKSLAAQILGNNGPANTILSNLKLAGNVLGTALTADNFSDYIYKGTAVTTAPSGCSFLNE